MKLDIELVPQTVWFSSLYRLLPKKEWDRLRKEQYKKAGYRCEICGAEGMLFAHEIWKYDDKNHIQKLVGFIALCNDCHAIKHTGFSMYTEEGRKKYDREKLVIHFCKVNNCSKKDFIKHEKEAFEKWKSRSQFEWKQDFGKWQNLIKK